MNKKFFDCSNVTCTVHSKTTASQRAFATLTESGSMFVFQKFLLENAFISPLAHYLLYSHGFLIEIVSSEFSMCNSRN